MNSLHNGNMCSLKKIVAISISALILGFAESKGQSGNDLISLSDSVNIFAMSWVTSEDSTNLSEPNGPKGGALDLQRYFGTYLHGDLHPCGDAISTTMENWITQYHLVLKKDHSTESYIKLTLWTMDRNGLFKFFYTVRENGTHARLWMDFYTLDGKKFAPEDHPEIYESFGISNLFVKLKGDIRCSE